MDMRRILLAALMTLLLVPLAPHAQAALCARCVLLGSDSGSGIKEPNAFHLQATGTAIEYRWPNQSPMVIEYMLIAEVDLQDQTAASVGQGSVQVFDRRSPTVPRYEFQVEVAGTAPIVTTTHGSIGQDWVFHTPMKDTVNLAAGAVAGTWKHLSGNSYAGVLSFAAP